MLWASFGDTVSRKCRIINMKTLKNLEENAFVLGSTQYPETTKREEY